MGNECQYDKIRDYKTAFDSFVQRFLKGKKSIFRLDGKDIILNKNSIKYLIDNFVNNGYIADKDKKEQTSSTEKFYRQLTGKDFSNDIGISIDEENEVKIQAIEVLAHAVWLWRLPAANSDGNGRKKSVLEILQFVKDWQCKKEQNNIDQSNRLDLKDNKYFGNFK